MTPLPDEQPLSRRQLREQQRTTETSSTPIEPRSRRVSTSSVTGGDIPEVIPAPEPELSTEEVAELEEAEAAGRPLTRRQARDLERVRTASLNVIKPQESTETDAGTSDSKDAAPSVEPADDEPAAVVEPAVVVDEVKPSTTPKQGSKKPKRSQAPAANRMPSFVPSSAPAAEADVVDAEIVPADIEDDSKPLVAEPRIAQAESAFGPAATAQTANRDAAPKVSSSFGQAVLSGDTSKPATVDQPFDQIIARGLEEAGNGVSTSSIILPSMPNGHPLTGPLSANGNVVITGSIDLSSGVGSTGAHPHFDRSDIDAMFDAEDEARPATAGTPVSASKAVSTHTATRDVITPPAPARSNRLLLILAITAGVLAVAVLSVIIVGIAAGAFQSR